MESQGLHNNFCTAPAILYECRIERFKIARGRVSQVNAKTETEQAISLVVGGTGLVGGYIVEHLRRGGERPLASRQTGRRLVSWRSGKAGHTEVPGVHDTLLHRRCHSPGGRTPLAIQPINEATCRLQFDQRPHKTGYGSRRRAGDDKKTRRRRAKDRRGMRTAQRSLDDIAAHSDLR